MNIKIPDSVDGKRRRDLLKIMPVQYAMRKFKTKVKACEFLGLSLRGLAYIINRYPELQEFVSKYEWEENDGYMEMLRRYPNE